MNKHPQPELFSAYIDDKLDVAQMHQTALHLQLCEACRITCTSLRETRDLLHHLPAPSAPPPDFWTNTYRQLRVDVELRHANASLLGQVRQSLLGTQRRWAMGAAVVALLGAVLAAPLVNSELHSPAQTTKPAAIMAPDVVDMSALVWDHTQSAAAQPLADSDRQTMLAADVDDGATSSDMGAEAASNGSFSSDATP